MNRRVSPAWVAELAAWTRANRAGIEAYHAQFCSAEGCYRLPTVGEACFRHREESA